jgi:hypothetical protein
MIKAHYILAGIITAGFIGLTGFYFFGPKEISETLKDPLLMVAGCWISNFTTVVSYFFGSSKSSSDKTALLVKQPT